jgi:hypothetical protein
LLRVVLIAGLARISRNDDALRLLVEHDAALGDLEDAVELVGDEDHREPEPLVQSEDQLGRARPSSRDPSPRRRLVEEDEPRLERHGPRDRRPLLHAARDLGRVVVVEAHSLSARATFSPTVIEPKSAPDWNIMFDAHVPLDPRGLGFVFAKKHGDRARHV